jgi:CheY-like chemotaxis protein
MIRFKLFGFGSKAETPAAQPPETPNHEAPPAQNGTAARPSGKRVLIVDDDTVFLRATAMKLNSAGFQVTTAKESSEAISALGEGSADVVLMDINFPPDVGNGGMGGWDGFQIMSWLRGLPSATGARFIMVSNSDTDSDRQRAQRAHVAAYFQKPLDHERLLAAINAAN